MTETALNERIAELQENESEAAHQRQKKLAAGCGEAQTSEKRMNCSG